MRSRSRLLSTRSGTYMPVPAMVAPRRDSGRGDMVRLDLLADVLVHALAHELGERADRALERLGPARAVSHEAHAVHAEQRRRAVFLPVQRRAQPAQRRRHEHDTEARHQVARDLLADLVAEQRRDALGGLEHDVPREAVRHDDVARALEHVAAFDVADEVQVLRAAQERQRLEDEIIALRVLFADRQQSDARVLAAEQVARVHGAHVRELDEIAGLAHRVRAHVEHDRALLRVREERGQRGPRHAVQASQPDGRGGDDRARVAGAEDGVDLPFLVQLREHAERRLALAAHGGRRLLRHLDLLGGVHDLEDRKSTRLNSSHSSISYAVFCLKKKKKHNNIETYTKQYYNSY